MELERELRMYKEQRKVVVKEKNILQTIEKSKEVFLLGEQQYSVRYFSFLVAQFRLIQKRWWVLQTLMLCLASILLPYVQNRISMLRILSVLGVLFVVLIIPEFWKNKHYDCMQIEGACLYSLRQIYAARMIWFGTVDMFVLTVFIVIARGALGLTMVELLIQFLFPMLVAACICFGTLCSNRLANEGNAILGCISWSAIWCFIILNETVYMAITAPVWCMMFGIFITFLSGAIYKTIHDCNECRRAMGSLLTFGGRRGY